ncbi:MAG: serine hydrolase domain-containing protein [Janthinobacterium lividum]
MITRLLLFCLLLAAGSASRSAHAQRVSPVISTLPALTDSIRQVLAKEHMPGLLLVLTTRDSVLYAGGLGVANVITQQPVTAHTLFRIGSVTKTFVAVGLLQLVAQGKLHLNDEVRQIAPEIPIDNPWEATDPVRVVHLLEHTAGFDDMHLNHVYNLTATDPRGVAGVAVFRPELRCRWRPGERMSYANPGYEVVGYLLEKFSGQPYEQYLAQHLLRPLGMPDATAALRPAGNPQLAQGYAYEAGQYRAVPPLPIYAGPAGSMSASAADMAAWVQFFLRDFHLPSGAALLPPGSLHEMETEHSSLAARAGLGGSYGLANAAMTTGGKALFRGHNGGIGGFISSFAYCQELGLGYALSNNSGHSLARVERLVRRFLLRHASALPVPPPTPLALAAVAPYLGHYQSAAPRQQLAAFGDYLLGGFNVVQRGSVLVVQPLLGAPDTLLPTGPLTFRQRTSTLPSAVFTHDRDGNRVLVSVGSYAVQAGFWWWLPPTLLALSVLLVATASLAGLVWLVYALRRQLPPAQVLPRVLPLLATLALLLTGWAFARAATHLEVYSGHFNLATGLLFAGPLAFAGCVLAGLGLLLYRFRQFRSQLAAWYLLLAYGGLGFIVAVLSNYGWLGMRLWGV